MTVTSHPFSVLMSVYSQDSLDFFRVALDSISIYQELQPKQMVIVCDGPLANDVSLFIARIEESNQYFGIDSEIVRLEENKGLAAALNIGLQRCTHDWVIRMDADDIAYPHRLLVSAKVVKEVCSGGLPSPALIGFVYDIFDQDENQPYARRVAPTIVRPGDSAAYRSTPFNHPTAIINSQAIKQAGGYPEHVGRFEDWGLALSLLRNGSYLVNFSDSVLAFRAPQATMVRRGGLKYLIEEVRAFYYFYRKNLMPGAWALLNAVKRAPIRLLPISARHFVYKAFIWR